MKPKLEHDLRSLMYGHYTLKDGRKVRGNSYTFVVAQLRSKGWRSVTYYNLTTMKGIAIARGRGMRAYRQGAQGLGVECDVVYMEEEKDDTLARSKPVAG